GRRGGLLGGQGRRDCAHQNPGARERSPGRGRQLRLSRSDRDGPARQLPAQPARTQMAGSGGRDHSHAPLRASRRDRRGDLVPGVRARVVHHGPDSVCQRRTDHGGLMDYTDILYQRRGDAVWITLNRPDVLNALRGRTFEELADAVARVGAERGLAAVVLTGAGERAFCAGGDVAEMRDLDPQRGRPFLELFIAIVTGLRRLPVRVIARIRGYCIAGGNELNLACDLAVASEDAQFGQAGPMVGSVPVILGTQMMPRLCGERFAKEVVFLCRRYSAREALERGWV